MGVLILMGLVPIALTQWYYTLRFMLWIAMKFPFWIGLGVTLWLLN